MSQTTIESFPGSRPELDPGMIDRVADEMGNNGENPDFQAMMGRVEPTPSPDTFSTRVRETMVSTRAGRAMTAAVASVALVGASEGYSADTAEAAYANPTVKTKIKVKQVDGGKSKAKAEDVASGKVVLAANHSTVSKAKIKEAMESGNCKEFTKKEILKLGIKTQGHMGTGVGYAYENGGRPVTGCDTDGDGTYDTRAECENRMIITRKPKPKKAKNTMWVKNKAKADVIVKSKSKASAEASCETESTSASASASAKAKARARISFKAAIKNKGKGLTKVISRISGKAKAMAESKASAKATTKCKESSVVVVEETPNQPIPEQPPEEQPEQNLPPTVSVIDREHLFIGGQAPWTAAASDPDNDPLSWSVGTSSNATHSGVEFPDPNDRYNARTTVTAVNTGPASVTFCVSDNRDAAGNFDPAVDDCATDTFNIEEDNF